ncbi:DUF2510 domain-containing protein [Rhodococcus pyridinivorans]|uniref:DUF2510 domain-containing protein n=1 Tax=Rhodococcus pyridinivorans TaxID=103816 RepID=UPI003AAA96AC
MTKPTPPGWYPDMSDSRGLERYWNGSAWEDRFRRKGSLDELTSRPPKETTARRPLPQKPPPSGKATVITLVVIVALIGFMAASCLGGGDEDQTRPSDSTSEQGSTQSSSDLIGTRKLVEQTCRDAVKNRLKSPSSAEFSGIETTQENDAGTKWTVEGSVDSENTFGASIRNTFTCSSTYDIASETASTNVTRMSEN